MVAVIGLVKILQQASTAAVLLDLLFSLMARRAKVGFRFLGNVCRKRSHCRQSEIIVCLQLSIQLDSRNLYEVSFCIQFHLDALLICRQYMVMQPG